jgi:hypothetical protein
MEISKRMAVMVLALVVIMVVGFASASLGLFAIGRGSHTAAGGSHGSKSSAPLKPFVIQGGTLTGTIAPSGLAVRNDDHIATVSWQASPDPATVGYKVTWGPTGALTNSFYTPYTVVQIQPLADGQTYQVEVQAVNKSGGLSAILGPATARTDPTYVNQLRQDMNGLFDDFDNNGRMDPTHWYASFNNASPLSSSFPFSHQQHWHVFLENGCCSDRGSLTLRSLRPFDFTNRTGTIVFDFDWARGSTGRHSWYLTLSPTLVDDINYDVRWNGEPAAYPLDFFQVDMEYDVVVFRKFQGGHEVQDWSAGIDDNFPGIRNINVRKHSVLTISRNSAALSIGGVTVLSATGLNLDFQRAWVYNQQFAYNLPKDHVPYVLAHWDNIGFDAPAGYAPDVIHTYTDGHAGPTDPQDAPASFTIQIPDSLAGATSARLFLDVRTDGGAKASLSVNGHSVPWQALPLEDNVAADARVFTLPVSLLHTGANTVQVSPSCGCGFALKNVHIEVAFPAGSRAPYTPPPAQGTPSIPPVAPQPSFGDTGPSDGATVSGTVSVEVLADGAYALLPTGHVDPVSAVSVDIDGQPVVVYQLHAPTVATDQTLKLDTTRLANGRHTLTVSAYGTDTGANGAVVALNSNAPILHDEDDPWKSVRTITVANGTGMAAPPETAASWPALSLTLAWGTVALTPARRRGQ